MEEKKKNKKVFKRIVLLVLLITIIVCGCVVAPHAITIGRNMIVFRGATYYTKETKPDSIGDWVDLCKYVINESYDLDLETSYENDMNRYAEPVWDYLLEKNQDLNNNYHANLLIKDILWRSNFSIDVDGNIAKVVLYECVKEKDNPFAYEKKYEYYMSLEDNVVTSYFKKEDGQWIKTERAPISEGCVALDLTGIVTAMSKMEPDMLPAHFSSDGFNAIWMESRLETYKAPVNEKDADYLHDIILSAYSDEPTVEHKLIKLFRNRINMARFVAEETDWAGKDVFLDYLCEYNTKTNSCLIDVSEYGNVTVELPEGIDSAELVDNFQFMADGMYEALISSIEKAEMDNK
jgi:hypothetical protein